MLRSLLDTSLMLRIAEVLDHRRENRASEFGMLAQAFDFVATNHQGQFAFGRRELEEVLKKKGFRTGEYELTEGFYDCTLTPELGDKLQIRSGCARVHASVSPGWRGSLF